MNYIDFLETNKEYITKELEIIFKKYKVQPVGNGYIDCIIKKPELGAFVEEISSLGIIIISSSWWCHVESYSQSERGCPHGLGGPRSEYYNGWFSELQNEFYDVEESLLNKLSESFDKQRIRVSNLNTLKGIEERLSITFMYTPTEYIEGNRCVVPGIWLFVPDNWVRKARK